VLGPIFENSLRQSLTLSHGSASIFFTRPIAAVLMTLTFAVVLFPLLSALAGRRRAIA
jgi:putative tricarboxylic transport membrane protein